MFDISIGLMPPCTPGGGDFGDRTGEIAFKIRCPSDATLLRGSSLAASPGPASAGAGLLDARLPRGPSLALSPGPASAGAGLLRSSSE
eukprot:2676168-Rhodomonas_salina.1